MFTFPLYLKGAPDGVARASDPDSLHHAGVLELVEHRLGDEGVGQLLPVWLNAADEVGVGLA